MKIFFLSKWFRLPNRSFDSWSKYRLRVIDQSDATPSGVNFMALPVSSTFYKLLCAQILKAQKDWQFDYLFALSGSASVKAARRMLMKLTPDNYLLRRFHRKTQPTGKKFLFFTSRKKSYQRNFHWSLFCQNLSQGWKIYGINVIFEGLIETHEVK